MKRSVCVLMCLMIVVSCFSHEFNGSYSGEYLNRIAFPMGGMGAGMICLEGTGALSHVSVRNTPDIFNEPFSFAAISVKGVENGARVLEGPVPSWKIFGDPNTGNGASGTDYGLPRFANCTFKAQFPFAAVSLSDTDLPLNVHITGWSPFVPTQPDYSSLPVAVLEYHFTNTSEQDIEAVFSFNAQNWMRISVPSEWGGQFESGHSIQPHRNGFVMHQDALKDKPHYLGDMAVFVDDTNAVVDHCWFRGGWFDPVTITWKTIAACSTRQHAPVDGGSPGASIYVPFRLKAGEEKTIKLNLVWYVPCTDLQVGERQENSCETGSSCSSEQSGCCQTATYKPWYAAEFDGVDELSHYWRHHADSLRQLSELFRDAFYASDLPSEVMEAVAANLTILKSPTVLRQEDGKLWAWEGCHDLGGCCYGSCTHVWNYAQAIPHLFPELERSLRNTEFKVSQNEEGHQTFRANLPVTPPKHNFHAAADGQLGGIMKVHREWRVSGDTEWLRELWPAVKQSLDYCIRTWDPKHRGVIEEPHHNTYDIEFWGPEPLCTGFYAGALAAAIEMGTALNDDVSLYHTLLQKGKAALENELFNGDYFEQNIQIDGLEAENPVELAKGSLNINYSPEALQLLKKEGPKYQYGSGCLSDGMLGLWIARMCGLGDILDSDKVQSHLEAVHRYNLKHSLQDHVNPQRPAFACGQDGGLLLCTWPRGGEPALPFVYSNEVWTGIEYQVASHLMMMGEKEKGLDIVRTCRKRYDGRVRNPFNEYECGHWYARAMASYGLIQGMTGVRYDAIEKTLYIDGTDDRTVFLSTATGFGTVTMTDGKAEINVRYGSVEIDDIVSLN